MTENLKPISVQEIMISPEALALKSRIRESMLGSVARLSDRTLVDTFALAEIENIRQALHVLYPDAKEEEITDLTQRTIKNNPSRQQTPDLR